MSRADKRARSFEYMQVLSSAIIIAVIGFFLLALNTRMVDLYESRHLDLPVLTTSYMSVHWLGLLLLPVHAAVVVTLKLRDAPRGVVTVTSIGLSLLAATWLGIGIWAYTVPLTRAA